MRPISLTLSGLRAYRETQTIQFAGEGLFAIVGENGAGKSSILEAIVYALYNSTTWDERNVKALIAEGMQTMRVELVFEADNKQYRIIRSTSVNNYPLSVHLLECLSPVLVGEERLRLDKEAQIRQAIKGIIGLDYDGFRSAVVLPQGRFQTLLLARPSEKTAILKGILRLDAFDSVRVAGLEASRRLRDVLRIAEESRGLLLADPKDEKLQAKKEQRRWSRLVKKLSRARQNILLEVEFIRKAELRLDSAQSQAARLTGIVLPTDEQVANLVAISLRMRSERNVALQRISRLKTRIEELSLGNFEGDEELGSRRASLTELLRLLSEPLEGRDEVDAALASSQARLVEANLENGQLRERIGEARLEQARLDQLYIAGTEYLAALELREEGRTTLACLQQELHGLQEGLESATRERQLARERVEEGSSQAKILARDDAVRMLRQGLREGDVCPVCTKVVGEKLAVEDHLHQEIDLVELRRLESEAIEALQAKLVLVAATEGRVQNLGAELEVRNAQVLSTKTALVEAGGSMETNASKEEKKGLILEGIRARKHENEEVLAQLEEALQAKLREIGETETELQQVNLRRGLLLQQFEERATRIAALQAESRLPNEAVDRDGVERVLADLETELQKRNERRRELSEVRATLEMTQREVQELEETLRSEVDSEISLIRQAIARAEAIGNMSFGAMEEISDIELSLSKIRATLGGLLQELRSTTESAVADKATSENRLNEILRVVESHDFDDLENRLLEAQAHRLDAERRYERASRELPVVLALEEVIIPGRQRLAAIEELAGMMTDARFVRFVVEKKEMVLLGVASSILGAISGGRLGFAEGFMIAQRGSGNPRDARTLSGGEMFLASLSLALALVEMAGREGGRLGAIFLDEGFGSLDAVTLDEALDALEGVAAQGRMVAVVSHLRAVSDRIERVLAVKRGISGSAEAHWIGPMDREEGQRLSTDVGLLH